MKRILSLILITVIMTLTSCTNENNSTVNTASQDDTQETTNAPFKIITNENEIKLSFEPYSDHIYIAEGKNMVRFIPWDKGQVMDCFCVNVKNIVTGKDIFYGAFDAENRILPYIEEKELYYDYKWPVYEVKPYTRYAYKVDENGKETLVDVKDVNRTIFSFSFDVTNFYDEPFTITQWPELVVIREDEKGNQYLDEYVYKNADGKEEFPNTPVCIMHHDTEAEEISIMYTDNPESKNYEEYSRLTIPAHETTTVDANYILDNDLYTSAYLRFDTADGYAYLKMY